MTTIKEIAGALYEKAGYVVVRHEESPGRLTLHGRVPQSGDWKVLRGFLWKTANGKESKRTWKVDISCNYFVVEGPSGDTQRYAWRLIFTGKDLSSHYEDICRVIAASPRARADVVSVPLPGGSDRNSPAGGRRGAAPMGKAVVGPAAIYAKKMGG